MGEAKWNKGPMDLCFAERVAQGWATLDHPAKREREVRMEGGSAKIRSQIVPKTGYDCRDAGGRATDGAVAENRV